MPATSGTIRNHSEEPSRISWNPLEAQRSLYVRQMKPPFNQPLPIHSTTATRQLKPRYCIEKSALHKSRCKSAERPIFDNSYAINLMMLLVASQTLNVVERNQQNTVCTEATFTRCLMIDINHRTPRRTVKGAALCTNAPNMFQQLASVPKPPFKQTKHLNRSECLHPRVELTLC